MGDFIRKRLSLLTKKQYHVTQESGTEAPFSGTLLHNQREGTYYCICCQQPLFTSNTKYDAGCGWPSFYQPIEAKNITYIDDFSNQMHRIEVRCSRCNAHLGHVFPDGPQPTGERYCINSAAMEFLDPSTGKRMIG